MQFFKAVHYNAYFNVPGEIMRMDTRKVLLLVAHNFLHHVVRISFSTYKPILMFLYHVILLPSLVKYV